MSGLYIHIPFCKSRCIYCGFYSTTRHDLCNRYVEAVVREWQLRRSSVDDPVKTIYLGGGTPSVLSVPQLYRLFDAVGTAEEVTLECNPDDVTPAFADALAGLPVNRVSMGAQTFDDERLRFLRRRHTARQVCTAIDNLRRVGIGNISVDLMYGFPGETMSQWRADVEEALSLDVEHLSAYALIYEEGTPLYAMQPSPLDEELERSMYYELKERLEAAGYEHYEISNFARPGRRSLHNSNYWNLTPYTGLGAAAHSYDGHSRQWNVDNVMDYITGVETGCLRFEREELDEDTCYNDLMMTALRTRDGLNLTQLNNRHRSYCLNMAARYVTNGLLVTDGHTLRLSARGLFVSDMIMADLTMV